MQRFEALKELPLTMEGEIRGELKLGMIPTLAPYLVPLFIEELQSAFPGLLLTIEELITEEIIRGIRNGHLDAGLISTPVKAGRLQYRPFFTGSFFFMYPTNILFTKRNL